MNDDTHNIILDHLRALRSEVADVKSEVIEVKENVQSLREDVHSLRGDLLRQERAVAALQLDMGRVKRRLDLVDA